MRRRGESGGDGLLVGAVVAVSLQDQVERAAAPLQLGRLGSELFAVDQDPGFGILEDEFQFGQRQAPVQRQVYGADARRGKQDFVVVGRVVAQRGDALARLHAGDLLQVACQRIDAAMHGQITEVPSRMPIVLRWTVRRIGGMVSDPVVMQNFHTFDLLRLCQWRMTERVGPR